MKIPTISIVISKEFYPRQKPDDAAVQRYRDAIDSLPPIEIAIINGENLLVDGYHRTLSHRLENRAEIEAIVREDLTTPQQVLAEAIRLNATHGLQLSRADKEQMARQLYGSYTVEQLAKLLSVTDRIVREWTRHARELEKFDKQVSIFMMFLAGATDTEIEAALELSEGQAADYRKNGKPSVFPVILKDDSDDEIVQQKQSIIRQYLGDHLLDPSEAPPSLKVYDVWNFPKCDDNYGSPYPGRIPGQIIENLLWYYTEPFSKVYDPFAGSGTTVDVCRAMFRRYWASDVRPFDQTKGVRQWDISAGKPDFFPKGYKMDLTFLDPPYWSMVDDDYPEGSVSRLDLDGYYNAMQKAAANCVEITASGGHLALLIQNQTGQGKGGFDGYLDHAFELTGRFKEAGWNPVRRIHCPMPPDNNGGANEAKAKEDRRMLGLVRDLVVFKAG